MGRTLLRTSYCSQVSRRVSSSPKCLQSVLEIRDPIRPGRRLCPSNDAFTIHSKAAISLPTVSRFRGPIPYALLFPETVHTPQPPGTQDVPKARCSETLCREHFSLCIDHHLHLASASSSLKPSFYGGLVAVGDSDEGDIWVGGRVGA